MQIQLSTVAKRYRFEWIFRNLNYTFQSGATYAVTGPNGSGKSTLMRLLSGYLSPTKGNVAFQLLEKPIPKDTVYQHVSYAAPYIDLIEEFTLKEHLALHAQFKPYQAGMTIEQLLDLLSFTKSAQKPIHFFSSGMKQRLKLVLAICSQCDLLLLDEPTTNLDRQGMDWYQQLIQQFGQDKTIIVASNLEEDFFVLPAQKSNIMAYK
ncbi:MAG: ABC transporter ATP-binding protein [Saprospiraceae bacterium]|nr:ABC transporter ATP-binding protein [Saprospiraceae bacterium]